MTQPKPTPQELTKDTLIAVAALSGLDLSEERLAELLPQMGQAVRGMDRLRGVLDLDDAEPAVTFEVRRE